MVNGEFLTDYSTNMPARYLALFLLPLLLFSGPSGQAQPEPGVSLITCAPGDYLYNMFGHTGLCVRDPVAGTATVYDYGIFDFQTPNFYLKFARGKLLYQVGRRPLQRFIAFYQRNGIEVRERPLQLSAAERDRLIELLEINYRPENRYYKYDFFFDNCATRIRDIVEGSIAQQLPLNEVKKELPSYRDLLHAYTGRYPMIGMGLDILLGMPADRPADYRAQMYLPFFLEQHLLEADLERGDLMAAQPQYLSRGKDVRPLEYPMLQSTFWIFCLISLVPTGLGIAFPSVCRKIGQVLFLLFGCVGVFLLLMWFGTDHGATKWNLNVLWANPLYLTLLFGSQEASSRRWKAAALLGSLVIWVIVGIIGWQYIHPAFVPLALAPMVFLYWRYRS